MCKGKQIAIESIISVQQFRRASTYMLPVSMVLAHIYQPYKVRIAMFSCYLFQHGLFIWKLFLVISILIVTSFKWLYIYVCIFFLSRAKTQVMHDIYCCSLPSKYLSFDWVSLTSALLSLECRWKGLTVNIWGRFPDACCFCIASKSLLNSLGSIPF